MIYHPLLGTMVGGISGAAFVAPATWGQFLLALELLILFRGFSLGRGGTLWFLVPLFALWANIDESFFIGLLILAAAALVLARWARRVRLERAEDDGRRP